MMVTITTIILHDDGVHVNDDKNDDGNNRSDELCVREKFSIC